MIGIPKSKKIGLVGEIVLTGGPASGKTSLLPFLRLALNNLGWRVLCCPEMATILYDNGLEDVGRIASEDRPLYIETQTFLIKAQGAMRAEYISYARHFSEPVLIIYDRAEMDAAAYLTKSEFQEVFNTHFSQSIAQLRDSYGAVIHLDTSPFADLSSSTARREETMDVALQANERTWEAWMGHPRHFRIQSDESLDQKREKTIEVLAKAIQILEAL